MRMEQTAARVAARNGSVRIDGWQQEWRSVGMELMAAVLEQSTAAISLIYIILEILYFRLFFYGISGRGTEQPSVRWAEDCSVFLF